jgi:hypothetical protein
LFKGWSVSLLTLGIKEPGHATLWCCPNFPQLVFVPFPNFVREPLSPYFSMPPLFSYSGTSESFKMKAVHSF